MQPNGGDRGRYILDGHKAVKCQDLMTWACWLEEHKLDGIVAVEHLGDYEVHTCFIGLDMNMARLFDPSAPPLLFESMVFSGFERSGEIMAQQRCSTWEEAERIHARLVARFRAAVNS